MAMNNNGGKGSAVRPLSVSRDEYANKFDAIFGKKKEPVSDKLIMGKTIAEVIDPKTIDGHTLITEVHTEITDTPLVEEDGLVKS